MSQLDLGIPQLSDARLIGSGGYAEVYVAHHQGLGRRVAVKVVARFDDATRLAEFERECAAMGRLSDHPHVVVPLSAGVTSAGDRYLLMEHYADGSCADFVAQVGPLGSVDLVDWVLQVGGALQVAHARGVLHNDVKPDNVLVSRASGGVRFAVADFGLAHLMDGHTASGATAGSLLYVAPELLDGVAPTPASDVYGLAATTCFMASGSAPFERRNGESWISLLRRIATESVDPAAANGVPANLRPLIVASLAKQPAERPSMEDLLTAARVPSPIDGDPNPVPLAVQVSTEPDALSVASDAPFAGMDEPSLPELPPWIDSAPPTPQRVDDPTDETSASSIWWFVFVLVALFVASVVIGSLFR